MTWEKRDALTGGRITEDAEYVFYEWNVDANEYEISSNYRVTRLENGLYTVTVTNPVYTDWTEGYVYYTQDNLGKFRIEEVAAPAGYTDAALQGTDWVEHWSQEFEITASDQTYSYTGNDADYNRPQGNKVIIKKIEAHTGEIIVDDAVFTLYQWNEERGLYEKSKDYAFVRDAEGLYTITCLHDDWSQYEEGNLYYEDTLCDVREDTVNSDGTTTEHPQYYTDYEPIDFSIDERAVTNDGQFVVVESKSPYGYYGDWTGDEDRTNYEAEDAGKRAYYIRLTDDGSTITIGNGNYNANVLTENQGGTLIDLGDKVVSLEVFGEAATEYPEDALYKNNPWYSSLTWEKRDALTGGRITEDAEYEIQEWNTEKGQYEKSTHYRVVRRDDGLYTVNLIDGAFFPGWEGKQGYVYYHQANEGKYRLVELTSPAGYTDAALQDGNWGEHWSQEFEVNDGHLTFSYTGKDADYNQPKGNRLVIKKIEAHTGEIIEDDAVFTLYQWNQARGLYEVSKDYAFTRDAEGLYTITSLHDDWTNYVEGNLYYEDTLCDVREDTVNSDGTISEHPIYYGKYTVHLIGDAFFEGWEGKQGVLYYHQANQGKYRIVELKAPASYNLKAWEHNNWVIGWSEEIVVHPDYPSYEFLGETASRNMPYKTKVLIKKVDDATGEFILPDTTWTLYEWNERNNQYEVSTNYKIVRREDGYYTVTTLHSDWTHYEEGYLYFEDTQTDYPDSGRWFSNEGKFLIVESQAPAGYYGDYWRNDEPGTHSTDNGSDLGKRGYAFTLTEDNGTLWLTNADYNAKILYDVDDQLGNATLVLADGRPTSVIINEDKQPEYNRPETAFTNKAKYGYVEFDRSQYRKEWAQTGDEPYTVAYDATTEEPEKEHLTAPNQLLWQNGMLYRLSDYTATLISGPVECQVETADIRSLEAVPATVEYDVGGQPVQLQLASAAWIQQPQEKHTGYVDMGYSPTQPKFEETSTFTAEDGTEFVGHLVEVEQTGDYQWISTEIPATYHGWPDVKGIYLGNLVLPHNDLEPVYEGYENDILDYLGLDPSTHHITGAAWTGSWQGQPGEDMMIRPAVFDLQVYATGWVGVYEDDVENQSGVALATYRLGGDENTDGLYHWTVTAHYHPMLSALQAAAAVLGVALLIAALVALLFILSRRRKETNKRTEVH